MSSKILDEILELNGQSLDSFKFSFSKGDHHHELAPD
jgi:hypothetical protein